MAAHGARHPGNELESAGEAITAIRAQPLGLLAVGLLLLGLLAYVVWQVARAVADPEDRGGVSAALANGGTCRAPIWFC